MNDRQIAQSNGQNFDQQQVLTNCMEILIPYEKSDWSQPEIYKSSKPFWLLN